MLRATEELTRAGVRYFGPGAHVMQVCYDKLAATRLVAAEGIECPQTLPANAARRMRLPLVLKPRQGSDSIGVRILHDGPVPAGEHTIAQEHIAGVELTVALIRGTIGTPLHIDLPPGVPYSFSRKYLWRPRRVPVANEQVRQAAAKIGHLLGVDWAARVDFILEAASGRLCFLECDVAPMIAAGSAFSDSLLAAGMARADQLRLLTA